MESAEFIQAILDNLNYFWITVLMAIESSFIPFPSELVVPPAAYMATIEGKMNIVWVVVFATLGADIGALVNYYLARWLGRPIVYRFAESRLGHMCLIDRERSSAPKRISTNTEPSRLSWGGCCPLSGSSSPSRRVWRG